MEHFTQRTVGNPVVGATEVGEVTAIEGDEAVLEHASALAAEMEAALSAGRTDALSVTLDRVETVTDGAVHVRLDR